MGLIFLYAVILGKSASLREGTRKNELSHNTLQRFICVFKKRGIQQGVYISFLRNIVIIGGKTLASA